MTNIAVIRTDERHVEDLAALRWAWRVEEMGAAGGSREKFTSDFRRWLDEHRDSHHGYLAIADNEPVGIAWLALIERIPGPERFERRSGYVQSVFVRASHRNLGVGETMLGELITDAKVLGLDYLVLHPTPLSVPFYRRLGFAVSEGLMELRFVPSASWSQTPEQPASH